jgi:hypothetical protein
MATEVSTISMAVWPAGGLLFYRMFDRRGPFPMLAEGAPSLRCHPSLVRPDKCVRPMLGCTVARRADHVMPIDNEKPFNEVWKPSIDGRAAFASGAVEFIRMRPDWWATYSRFSCGTTSPQTSLANAMSLKWTG